MPSPYQKYAGTFLFIAGFIAMMGIITGEIFYPAGYSTANSEISDLGSTRPLKRSSTSHRQLSSMPQ
jgi:hypothetical protein